MQRKVSLHWEGSDNISHTQQRYNWQNHKFRRKNCTPLHNHSKFETVFSEWNKIIAPLKGPEISKSLAADYLFFGRNQKPSGGYACSPFQDAAPSFGNPSPIDALHSPDENGFFLMLQQISKIILRF